MSYYSLCCIHTGEGYDIAEDVSDEEGQLPPPPVPEKTHYSYSYQEDTGVAAEPSNHHDNHYDDVELTSKSGTGI